MAAIMAQYGVHEHVVRQIAIDGQRRMKVLVTTPFKLNLGVVDGIPRMVEYEAGAQDMPEDHFRHWWSQTHNVKSLEQPAPISARQPPAQLVKPPR